MAPQSVTLDAASETTFSNILSTSYYTIGTGLTAYDITATNAVSSGYIQMSWNGSEAGSLDLSAAGSGGGFRINTQYGEKTITASQGDDFLFVDAHAHNADIYDSGGIDSLYINGYEDGTSLYPDKIQDFTAYVDTTGGTPFLTISYDSHTDGSRAIDARDSPAPTRIALETDMVEYLDLADGTRVDMTQIRDAYVGASFSGSIDLTDHIIATDNGAFDMAHYTMPALTTYGSPINFHGNVNDHVTLGTSNGLGVFLFKEGDDTVTGSSGKDHVSGGADQDLLSGAAGNDTLFGDSGHDAIYGNAGIDRIEGGSGNDTLYGGAGNDLIDYFESATLAAGTDVIYGGAGADSIGVTIGDTIVGTASDFENDYLFTWDYVGFENGTTLVFTDHDASHLDGEVGASTNDIYDSPGSATFRFGPYPPSAYKFVADYDTISGDTTVTFERIIFDTTGTTGADEIFGGSATSERISGLAGDDSIDGSGGTDTLYGDGGDDHLLGQLGDDALYGGADDDALYGGEGNDSLFGEAGVDVIYGNIGVDIISGGAGDDALYGGQGDDTIEGGNGNDVIVSGLGSDLIIGGAGNDTVSGDAVGLDGDTINGFEFGDEIVVRGVDLSALDGTLVEDTIDLSGGQTLNVSSTITTEQYYTATYDSGTGETTLSIANSTTTGTSGDDTITGTSGDDAISGLAGDDVLIGGLGDDTLSGGDGDDVLFGGDGSDTMQGGSGNSTMSGADGDDLLVGGAGADTMDGGSGTDMVGYDGSSTGVFVRLDFGTGLFGDAAGDVISNVENLSGSSHQDTLVGDSGANVIYGGDGDDFLLGFDGNDTLSGEAGDDTLFGIFGGDNRFAFSANDGDDQIRFMDTDGSDKIQLNGYTGISSFSDVSNVATTTGDNTLLDFGSEGSINLIGVSSINSSMFEFG